MIVKKIFLLIICVSYWLVLPAQTEYKQALAKVRSYNKKINNIGIPEYNQVYFMDFKSSTVMWDSLNTPAVSQQVKIYLGANYLQYISNSVELYQDQLDAFMVVHPKKTVFWTHSSSKTTKANKVKEIGVLRDTLFSMGTPLYCRDVKTKSENKTQVGMKINEKGRKIFKISQIEITYDNKKDMISDITTYFVQSYPVKRLKVTYNVLDFNYKMDVSRPVAGKILNKKNLLISKYKGYKLIDKRK